jgi:hypothetical protein
MTALAALALATAPSVHADTSPLLPADTRPQHLAQSRSPDPDDLVRQLFEAQVAPCWAKKVNTPNLAGQRVVLRWRMQPDGRLDGRAEAVSAIDDAMGLLASAEARVALDDCQPYWLPPALHESHWKAMTWEFRFGGLPPRQFRPLLRTHAFR